MKVYISGAITNNPYFMEEFEKAEDKLREMGYAVINPAKVNSGLDPETTSHEEYMKVSFVLLDMADAIYLLKTWKHSLGANQEYGFAMAKDKIIMFE